MPSLEARLRGGMLGLLLGDALGVPYEFHPPEALPTTVEMEPPGDFDRAHVGVPPGTWSDDGAQALALLASLLHCGRFDANDFGRRLVSWYEWGEYAVDGVVFDVGVQTAEAIRAIRAGTPALEAASRDSSANGNGSLMRVLPVALFAVGDDASLVADAFASSAVTHAHPRAQLCCALYCLHVRALLEDVADPLGEARRRLRASLHDEALTAELEYFVRPDELQGGRGSGYVVDSLRSALDALDAGDFEAVVRYAVRLGHDTDTTAAIAGGLAGVRDGLDALPTAWPATLRGRELAEPLIDALVAHRAKGS
ncbi:MAG: ADP-ribosylglycohydrolase family protein [Polyangiales bacterium]